LFVGTPTRLPAESAIRADFNAPTDTDDNKCRIAAA
jgi:hypothetical protein